MDTPPPTKPFSTAPGLEEFEGVADVADYRPLPDGWALATADIVGSTKAIAGGALQGGQHGRRQRHLGDAQRASASRTCPSCSAATARSWRSPARRSRPPGSALAAVQTWVSGGARPRACAPRSCRSPTFARRASTCASPASRPAPKSRLRHVRRRRRQLGRGRDEGRPLPHRAGARPAPGRTSPGCPAAGTRSRRVTARSSRSSPCPAAPAATAGVPATGFRHRRAGRRAGARRPSGPARRARHTAFRRAAWIRGRAAAPRRQAAAAQARRSCSR